MGIFGKSRREREEEMEEEDVEEMQDMPEPPQRQQSRIINAPLANKKPFNPHFHHQRKKERTPKIPLERNDYVAKYTRFNSAIYDFSQLPRRQQLQDSKTKAKKTFHPHQLTGSNYEKWKSSLGQKGDPYDIYGIDAPIKRPNKKKLDPWKF